MIAVVSGLLALPLGYLVRSRRAAALWYSVAYLLVQAGHLLALRRRAPAPVEV